MEVCVSDERYRAVEGLEVHEVEDGLVVYDAHTDRVHHLNAAAALVFTLSDGTRTEEELAELVGAAWQLDEPPVDSVRACAAQLREEGVLR
jgi:coenzyme PQQ synthesis protein D (PqqD)